jgi:LysR family glycine cleavage system transcriptional activator
MDRHLPPLNALRAFESAARHLSFTKAAAELHVTPAAISHQIGALEAFYGVQLFRRLTRALLLTEAAQAALPALRDGFDRLAEGAERLRAHQKGGALTVSVAPSFAAKWLVPRLQGFREAHPDIELRIDANDLVVDFARDNVDIGLRYGRGDYPGLQVDRLLAEEVAPVCSPRLMEGPNPLRAPADLRHHVLLHVDWKVMSESSPNWRMWLLAAGAPEVDATRGPRFSMESMAVQAAIEGQGVALTSMVLAADDIRAGRLVRPFEISLGRPESFAYYVVAPQWKATQPKIKAFRDWVIAESRRAQAPDEAAPAQAVAAPKQPALDGRSRRA